MKRFQGTVSRPIHFAGVGLHSGKLVNIKIFPQDANTGILFQRSDLDSEPVLASPENITATTLCTTIGTPPSGVSTIEHLMAAFYGLGIDNALVQIDAAEVPILDGSAAPFVDKLSEGGLQIQHKPKQLIRFDEAFEVREGDQYVSYEPPQNKDSDETEFHCSIDFDSSAIGAQSFSMVFTPDQFMKISEARTFCHIDSVNAMRAQGLALGGSLDNAVVVDDERVLNAEGLRYKDEFVRHKLLDCLGDLALLPGLLVGKIHLHKAGHKLHATFTRKVMERLEAKASSHQVEDCSLAAASG